MENTIVSIICIVLLLFGGMTMAQGFLSSVDSNAASWTEMGERDADILRTELSEIAQISPGEGVGGLATTYITMANTGKTKLADFDDWDLIVQYYDTGGSKQIRWLPYTPSTPGDNEWTVVGIYLDVDTGTPEVFEPGILNPGEETKLRVRLNPLIGNDTTNLMTISTPNGVSSSVHFYGLITPPPPPPPE
jgi:hypothetical protein